MEQNNKRPWNFYFQFVAGLVFGFEFMGDDEGETAVGIQLLFVRVLITRDKF
jgi:hypothetical protein